MKKIGPIFVLLALLVGGIFAWMYFTGNRDIATGEDDKLDSNKENKKGEIKFLNSKLEESTITQKYKAYINGKELDMEVVYSYKIDNIDPELNEGYSRLETVEGKLNGTLLYKNEKKTNSESQKAELFETTKIDKVYNGDYFKVVRGTDGKDYIAIATHFYDIDYDHQQANYLYILNDELEIINRQFKDPSNCSREAEVMMIHPGAVGLLTDMKIWYNNQFSYDNHRKNYTSLKIEDDKIYYLYHDIKTDSDGNYGAIEERMYTINNDKLEYTTLKTYRAESMYGDICSQ